MTEEAVQTQLADLESARHHKPIPGDGITIKPGIGSNTMPVGIRSNGKETSPVEGGEPLPLEPPTWLTNPNAIHEYTLIAEMQHALYYSQPDGLRRNWLRWIHQTQVALYCQALVDYVEVQLLYNEHFHESGLGDKQKWQTLLNNSRRSVRELAKDNLLTAQSQTRIIELMTRTKAINRLASAVEGQTEEVRKRASSVENILGPRVTDNDGKLLPELHTVSRGL